MISTLKRLLVCLLLTALTAALLPAVRVRAAGISAGEIPLTLTKVFSKNMGGLHTQGFTVTDKYMILSLWKDDDHNTKLYIYDRDTLEPVSGLKSNPVTSYNFKHCNDMSYNSSTEEILVSEGSTQYIDVLDAGTLERKAQIRLDRKYSAYAYNSTEDSYVCLSNVKKDHDNRYAVAFIYASDRKKMLGWFPAPSTLTSQALTVHNGLVYLLEYEAGKKTIYQRTFDASRAGTNTIYVYDMNGDLVKTYFIGRGYGEGEGIAFRGNELLVSFAGSGRAIVCSAGKITDTAAHGGIDIRPQSESSGTGAVYQIINRGDSPVTVSGAEYAPGEVIYQITTGSGGWSSSDRWLPYGSYELRQLSAPSYAGESEMADIFFAITKDGDITDIPV